MGQDRYLYHKLAVFPFVAKRHDTGSAMSAMLSGLKDSGAFIHFVLRNGLGPLWASFLKNESHLLSSFQKKEIDILYNSSRHAAIRYLQQKNALGKLEVIFQENSVNHVVIKGGHVRELVYLNPAGRPAADIDILVSRQAHERAIAALVQAGGILQAEVENISHEVSLNYHGVNIDLHWDILRPGRTRENMVDHLLDSSQLYPSHRGLGNEATLFLMLVHPVFSKYSTSHLASLIRLVDLHFWIRKREIDYSKVLVLLKKGGVCSAAWITTQWYELLSGNPFPDHFTQNLKPSPLKASYLQQWILRDLASRLFPFKWLVQAGFTLPAHDTVLDALRAVRILRSEKKKLTTEYDRIRKIGKKTSC